MVKYLCDNCSKRTRDSDGIYTRCTYMGDVKKRTDCGRYVRREPALMIAIRAGQVEQGETFQPNKLFSEDLNQKCSEGDSCDECDKIQGCLKG